MEFKIATDKSVNDLMRTIGYSPAYFQNEGEFSMVRKITGNDYPRFHLYIKEIQQSLTFLEGQTLPETYSQGKNFVFNLHLDQKKPSYEKSGAHRHSGDYDGPVVENEAERIKSLLQ